MVQVKFESEIPISDDVLNTHDVIESIAEMLYDAYADVLTELYNSLCSDKIEYIGDSLWERRFEDE
jgi:hypothetical protein